MLNGTKAANEYGVLLSTAMAANLPWGPWQGEKWFNSVLEGAVDMNRLGRPSDPLFEFFIPRILRDLGYPVWRFDVQNGCQGI